MIKILFLHFFVIICIRVDSQTVFEPTWDSIDNRSTPVWYDSAKIGIMLNWGVSSVPSFGSDFLQNLKDGDADYNDFMRNNYPKNYTYQEFAADLNGEFFNAEEIIDLFQKAGAKYVIFQAKQLDGYTLWPSTYSYSWNSVDYGPGFDVIAAIANEIKSRTDLHFGIYYSLAEYYNPLYEQDKNSEFSTNVYYQSKVKPELRELIELYKPEIVWCDGSEDADETYWESKEFIAWLYSESSVKDTVIVNDRWGNGVSCKHGDIYTCITGCSLGVFQGHKWEKLFLLDKKSTNYRRNANIEDYASTIEIIHDLVVTTGCSGILCGIPQFYTQYTQNRISGNFVLNVALTKEGTVDPIIQQRLLELGDWLDVNGEAIYGSVPHMMSLDSVWGFYNYPNRTAYLSFFDWPENDTLILDGAGYLLDNYSIVTMLGGSQDERVTWVQDYEDTYFYLPPKETIASDYVWIIKINNNNR